VKVGDLVRPSQTHGLRAYDWRSHGLVLEYFGPRPGYKEHVTVQWNNGDIEIEVPAWLEIINESR
jgi:hypothetical protein